MCTNNKYNMCSYNNNFRRKVDESERVKRIYGGEFEKGGAR